MPLRAMKPTAALTLKGSPRIHSASTPPTAARGIPVKTISVDASLLRLVSLN